LCVEFAFQGEVVTEYEWNFGDNSSNTIDSAEHCYQNSGVYSVSLVITDAQGCSATISQNDWITVHPQPVANFSWEILSNDNSQASVQFTNTSLNGDSFLWEFPDGTSSDDEHPIYGMSLEGSSATACIELEVMPSWIM
jgi:PKD repeat protein